MADSRRLRALTDAVLAAATTPSGSCAVALSGGPDSAICAWAALQEDNDVRAVHVDHGLAGSPMVRTAAIAIAEHLGIPLQILEVDVGSGSSPEGRAREARYEALLGSLGPDEVLLTGHTRSDQAETVLGNLLRGAGPDGLSGIPRRRGKIVRPLLDVSRSQTRELATLLGLPWVEDPANLEAGPRRNLIRREAIPYLESRFNPSLEATLARSAEALAVEGSYLEERTAKVPIRSSGGTVGLPAALLTTVDDAIATRAIRGALRLVDSPYAGAARDVRLVLDVAGGVADRASLTGGVSVERDRAMIVLLASRDTASPPPVRWIIPGDVRFGDWTLQAWVEEASPKALPLGTSVEVFEASAVASEMTVRTIRQDDLIAIAGGHKEVSEAMAEAGLPPRVRSLWPVVADADDRIVWVPGVRRAHLGWVESSTTRYLWVRATREDA